MAVARSVDEASIELTADGAGLAEDIRREVSEAISAATAGAGGSVTLRVDTEFNDGVLRTKVRQIETYLNQVRTRQQERDRRYFALLTQRINTVFNRLKLRITQAIAQVRQLEARLKAVPNRLRVEIEVVLDENEVREQLAALARDKKVELEADLDLGKATAELEAWRRGQEARPVRIPVEVDEEQLRRYSRTLGETNERTTGLTRSTEGLNRVLGDEEAVAARVANLEERIGDARAKSEAATLKRKAAEEGLERAIAQHERTGAALEQAERRIAELRTQTVKSTKELEQAEAEAAKARETHSKATEAYFTAESKATTARNAAEKATRAVTKAEGDHESALTRLRRVEQESDTGTERRIGLFGRLGQTFGRTGRLLADFGNIGSTAAQLFGGFSNVLGAVTSQSASFSSVLPQLSAGLGQLAGVAGTVGSAIMSTVGAFVSFGLEALKVIGIVSAVSFVIGNLSALVVALPGLLVAGAAAFGVIKLATEGFGDAIKEANTPEELKKQKEALDKLSPSAKRAAVVINQEVRPAFKGLQEAVQERFFLGFDKIFSDFAKTTVPALKAGLLDVTTSVRDLAQGLARLVTGQQNADRLRLALGNVKVLIDTMAPGVVKLVDSFLNVSAATGIMRTLGGIIGDVTGQVGEFINEMLRTGQAQRTLDTLRGVISSLVGVITTVAKKTMEFAEAANPGVSKALGYIQSALEKIDFRSLGDSVGRAGEALGKLIDSIPPQTWAQITDAVKRLADQIVTMANDPGIQAFAAAVVGAVGQCIDFITTLLGWFRALADGIVEVGGKIGEFFGAVPKGATDAALKTGPEMEKIKEKVKGGMDGAAAAARAGAAQVVDGVRIPIAALPGLTQQEFDKLPQPVKDGLQSASLAVQAGAPAIPKGMQGPLSEIPGIAKAEFDKLPPPIQEALRKARDAGTQGAADVTKGVGDGLKGIPDAAKTGVAPAAPAVKDGMDKAADAGKQGSTLVVANVDFAPIVDKAREVFGRLPEPIKAGIDRAVTEVTTGGTRIVAALKLDGLREAAQRGADAIPVAIKTAMAQAENEAKTGTQRVITAANFAGIATSAETELAKIPVSVQTHLTTAVTTATTLGQQLQQFWAALMQSMVQLTEQGWQQMLQTEQQGAQQSVTLVQALAQQINQIFAQLAAALYTAGYNMMIRLAQGINAGGQQAIQAAQNVANAIQGLFPMSPPKWGPLSGEGDPMKSGGRIMSRVAEGIEANSAQVTAALAPALNAIAGSLDNATPGQRAAAVSASNPAAATRVANARTLPAADTGASSSGPSAADIEAATYAGTARALGEAKVQMAGGFIEYVTAGQRRDDRRAGRRGTR